ncbi:MAG TPA: aldo/keto reductase [Candidatus Sulfotelmatobacter sp.]|nr:aldo/keto reductase [Candidatus Sulfotelmatobacter sp.]
MDKCALGVAGPEVSRVALGCMAMSGVYGPVDDAESICTIQEAIDQGINLLDTGDFYGMGHNEILLGRAIQGRRDKVLLSVKFGAMRTPSGGWAGYDARPAAVKNFLAYSLRRLGVDYLDIYRPARLDPKVPIEETVGAIAELIKEGHVRHIGLSEMSAETVRRANAVHPIVDLQIEYSLVSRGVERDILPSLREMGIGITAYGLLSRGLLSGSKPGSPRDIRAHFPRFAGENLQTNAKLVAALNRIAKVHNVTGPQLAVAWVLQRGTDIVPLLGPRTREQLRELLGALRVTLSAEELSRIEQALPEDSVAGTRYDARQMAVLDSERAAKATS